MWSAGEREWLLTVGSMPGSDSGARSLGPEPILSERGLVRSGEAARTSGDPVEVVLSPSLSSKVGIASGRGALSFLVGVVVTELALIDFL
jgi:hypothetical protein